MPKTVAALADELFGLVQLDQGKGFVSDGLEVIETRAEFFEIVRGHLEHSERACQKLRAFLRKYDELGRP